MRKKVLLMMVIGSLLTFYSNTLPSYNFSNVASNVCCGGGEPGE
ncbi:hypothetical protein [Cytobacillus sp. IB215665]|nr:hypothetical protein [Cytobacillus sp. IB215665]MDX8365163.1 hypothetical protein [Cytobacillus sp. IB215665]